jgi:acyl dehydratase
MHRRERRVSELLYAEDLTVGAEVELGSYRVTLEEILEFAGRWDPQVFHVDEAAAGRGFFGGIIASGVHTVAIYQRLAVLGAYRYWAVIAGRRVTAELLAPVTPGMTVTGTLTIERVNSTRPDRALVTTRGRLRAPDGVTVFDSTVEAYLHRRGSVQSS